MAFANTSIKHLFPTPFVISSFAPDVGAELNRELIPFLLKKSETSTGVHASNAGGWQSDAQLPEWGGKPVETILTALKDLIAQVTLYQEGQSFKRGAIDWKINGWANINRKGDANLMHTHPGAYWSAVYYVLTGDEDSTTQQSTGGELELLDPRGPMPMIYCPLLRFGIDNYMTAGGSELHKPKAGQCILFPSWLQHGVKPYTGDKIRISLAFNFSV
jgi:uncharacterized protein (TIGR02466 family)